MRVNLLDGILEKLGQTNSHNWTFGVSDFPVKILGNQLGFNGERSSLFFAVTGLIKQLKEEDKPSILLIENVKNLLSVNRGFDFAKLIIELDEIGYDCEWQVLNSKDFGVPQSRERVFIIGHLRGRSKREVFPIIRGSSKTVANQKVRPLENNDIGGVAIPVLTPDRVIIRTSTKKGYDIAIKGDSISLERLNSKRCRVGKGIANTLTCSCN